MTQDPFRQMKQRMQQMFEEFDQQFGAGTNTGIGSIPIDVEETDESYILRADIPGVEKDHIDVEASEDSIEISATDDREVEHEEKNYYRRERSNRSFYRRVALPTNVDPESATATYENGVLEITLEKTAANRSHIEVQ